MENKDQQPDLFSQPRAVALALIQALGAAPAETRSQIFHTIPARSDEDVKEDFDHILGTTGQVDLITSRLAATNHHAGVFLQLLAGACSRADDSVAMHLLDSLPEGERIEVNLDQGRFLASNLMASPSPSLALVDRIANRSGPLEFTKFKHIHKSGVPGFIDALAKASIIDNNNKCFSLLANSDRLFDETFYARTDFWILVEHAARSMSDKSIEELAKLQDRVFATFPNHHNSQHKRDQEARQVNSMVKERIENLSPTILHDNGGVAAHALRALLKMDIPLHPDDQALGARADWRILGALAPVQSYLGEQYTTMARPALRNGSPDVFMDAMVFGTDTWWKECLEHVQQDPENMADETHHFHIFLEDELSSRLSTEDDVPVFRAIDHLHDINPDRAGTLAARLAQRVPELARIIGTDAQRKEWSASMKTLIDNQYPMTAAMFKTISMGMNVDLSKEPARPAPRM